MKRKGQHSRSAAEQKVEAQMCEGEQKEFQYTQGGKAHTHTCAHACTHMHMSTHIHAHTHTHPKQLGLIEREKTNKAKVGKLAMAKSRMTF